MGLAIQYGFRLGTLEVYPKQGEIVGDDGPILLGREAFCVLVVLAERFPDLVMAAELRGALAETRAVDQAEAEAGLARAIEELSSALGQAIPASDLIECVAGAYRLSVPVAPLDAVADYVAGYDAYYVDDEPIPDEDIVETESAEARVPETTLPAHDSKADPDVAATHSADSHHLKFFVSSPGDVRHERAIVHDVIERLQEEVEGVATLESVLWEEEPLLATDTFQAQLTRPSDCDVMIAILWSRLGTPLSDELTRADGSRYESGTEYEFEDAVRGFHEHGRPQLLVYRKTSAASVSLDDESTILERVEQKKMLDEFLHRWFHNPEDGSLTGAFHPFETPQEFAQLLEGHLRKIIHRLDPETNRCTPLSEPDKEIEDDSGWTSRIIRDLHERRVFRVIFGYPVAAWVVLQVADVLANYFGMETRDFQPLLAGLIGGYPVAIFLAWLLQLTRRGVIIHPDHRDPQGKLEFWHPATAALAAVIVAMSVGVGSYAFMTRSPIEDCDKTIAVLPFENFSPSDDDAYLGKGFAEEMLHKLAQIEGMKVASRTASFNLRAENMEFDEIGTRLGVCHLLEGSIRRQGDMLRITVQLIDTRSNYHIWSRTYDRKMADLFAVYEDIAQAISDKLRISLGQDADRKPEVLVTNAEAYDHYLQARSILSRADDEARLKRAGHFFARAVELDPGLARAWAGQCETELGIFRVSKDVARVASAETYCRRALQIDPSLTEVRVALATVYINVADFEAAHEELRRAAAEDPDNPDVLRTLGDLFAEEGSPTEAEAAFRDAIRIASTDVRALQSLGVLLFSQGRFEESVDAFQKMIEASGGSSAAYNGLGAALSMLGRFDDAGLAYREVLASEPSGRAYSNVGINYFYQGQFEDAEVMLREAIELSPDDYRLVGNLADALRQLPGREQETQDAYSLAARLAEAVVVTSPTDVEALSSLGHFYAQLGELEKAHVAANAALAADQNDIYANYYASLVWLEAGDVDRAIEAIEKALDLGLEVVMLRADPQFERLNADPRYVRLLE